MRAVFLVIFTIFILGGCTSKGIDTQGPETFVSDTVLEAKVKTALLSNRGLEGFTIHVNAHKGVVQLSGFVDNAVTKEFAGQIARSVDGVREVINNLIVSQ